MGDWRRLGRIANRLPQRDVNAFKADGLGFVCGKENESHQESDPLIGKLYRSCPGMYLHLQLLHFIRRKIAVKLIKWTCFMLAITVRFDRDRGAIHAGQFGKSSSSCTSHKLLDQLYLNTWEELTFSSLANHMN